MERARTVLFEEERGLSGSIICWQREKDERGKNKGYYTRVVEKYNG